MSDNVPLDLCLQQMDLSLPYIPPEVWTDVFKLFSRRTLVQHIQPVNWRFKEISNRNVKSIHLIEGVLTFLRKLVRNEPEANEQLAHLAGHKCLLAGQFRFISWFQTNIRGVHVNDAAFRAVISHCFDLFRGCQIRLFPLKLGESQTPVRELAYLNVLEPTRPIHVLIVPSQHSQLNPLLRHPTILNCSKLTLWPRQIQATVDHQAILDWLHHKTAVKGEDSDMTGAEPQEEEQVRCLLLFSYSDEQLIQWLLEGCLQNLLQSRSPLDRCQFVLSFEYHGQIDELDKFGYIQQPSTGEVLLLENVQLNVFRFRRCLANEIDGQKEFYEKMFKSANELKIEDEAGDGNGKAPIVCI